MTNETNVAVAQPQVVSNVCMTRNSAKNGSSEVRFKAVMLKKMQKNDSGDLEDSTGKPVNCIESNPKEKNEEATQANGSEQGVCAGQIPFVKDVQILSAVTVLVPMHVLTTENISADLLEIPVSGKVMQQTGISTVPPTPAAKMDGRQITGIETIVSQSTDSQTVLPAATNMAQPQNSLGNTPENWHTADTVLQNPVKIRSAGELHTITEVQAANAQDSKQILRGSEASKIISDTSLPGPITAQKINGDRPVFFSGDAGIVKESGISQTSESRNNTFLNLIQDSCKETAALSQTQGFESNNQAGENRESLQQNAKPETKMVVDNDVGSQMLLKSSVSADFTVTTGKPEAAITGQPHATVETQIVVQIKEQYAAGKNEFEMQLSPENLGKITVKMTMKASSMVVEIIAANKEAQSVISSGSAELRSMLQNRFESPVNVQIVSDEKNPYFEDHSSGGRHQRNDAQQENREDQTDENQTYTGDFLSLMELIGNARVS